MSLLFYSKPRPNRGPMNRNQDNLQPQSKRLLFLISFLSYFLFSHYCQADFLLHHWSSEGLWESPESLEWKVQYYETQSNFNSLGNAVTVKGLNQIARTQIDLTYRKLLNRKTTGYARIASALVSQSGALPAAGFGLTDQSLGLHFQLWNSQNQAKLGLQFQMDFPGYSLEQSLPPRGDGSMDLTGGFFFLSPLFLGDDTNTPWSFELAIGVQTRTRGFSEAIPVQARLNYQTLSRRWKFHLGLIHLFSLETDTSNRNSQTSSNSFLTQAKNPSIGQLDLGIHYQLLHNWEVCVQQKSSIFGRNAPNGFSIGLGLTWRNSASHHKDTQKDAQNFNSSAETKLGNSNDVSGRVMSVNDRLHLVKIDQGTEDGVAVGQIFDIFIRKPMSSDNAAAIAQGRVSHVRENEAAIEIKEYYQGISIERGDRARRLAF